MTDNTLFKRIALILGALVFLCILGALKLPTYLAHTAGCAEDCARSGSCGKLELSLQVAESRLSTSASPLWYRVELKNPGCLKVPVDARPFLGDEAPLRAPFDNGFSLTLYDSSGRALEPRSPDSDGIRLYQVDPARLHRLFQDGTLDKNGSIILSDGEKLVTAPSALAPYRIELQEVTEQGSRGTMFVRVPAKAPKSALAPPAGFKALEGYRLKPGRYQLVAAYRSKLLNWRDYPRLRRLPATLVRVLRFLHLAPAEEIDEILVAAEPSRVDIEVGP